MHELIEGRRAGAALAAILLAAFPAAGFAGAHAQDGGMDHSDHAMHSGPAAQAGHAGHDMAGHSAERDELGRRLYGMKHNVTPEVADELRAKIPLFSGYSDAEIGLSMEMMGSNYAWYLSGDDVAGTQGVLMLLHGFKNSDPRFKAQVEPMSRIFPTAMAPGMSMMMSDHIQLAIDDIEAAGAKTIVVVPIVSTRYNTMMRQWEYILGRRDEAAYATVPRVEADAEILIAPPPGDDPLVAEILIDHALELSEDPAQEFVVIAAHGPQETDDNERALAELRTLARYVREDGGFAGSDAMTLQDDTPPEIRDRNVEKLRAIVSGAQAKGYDVIVVTNLIGTRTIQSKLRSDLKGLDYRFSPKGITEHPNFMKWMGEAVRNELERNARAARAD